MRQNIGSECILCRVCTGCSISQDLAVQVISPHRTQVTMLYPTSQDLSIQVTSQDLSIHVIHLPGSTSQDMGSGHTISQDMRVQANPPTGPENIRSGHTILQALRVQANPPTGQRSMGSGHLTSQAPRIQANPPTGPESMGSSHTISQALRVQVNPPTGPKYPCHSIAQVAHVLRAGCPSEGNNYKELKCFLLQE